MKYRLFFLTILAALFSSCRVDFSPNAQWKDVPAVFCVLDIDEDTVWARVQRCYLGEDNLYNYSMIADSNNYPEGAIRVVLNAYRAKVGNNHALTMTGELADSWDLTYTLGHTKPDGLFSSEPQPLYYCVPGSHLVADSDCVFQLLVIRTKDGDTLSRAVTSLVKKLSLEYNYVAESWLEPVLVEPNNARGHHYGFIPVSRNIMKWNTIPRGRLYQPSVRFYYRKGNDTLSVDVLGDPVKDERSSQVLTSSSITQTRFLSTIKQALLGNTDSLFNVNYMDISIFVGNEDLNAYINSQSGHSTSGQEHSTYSNIEGGVGIFASRRTHVCAHVPCDSTGKKNYLPDQLRSLGVGFYGDFGE